MSKSNVEDLIESFIGNDNFDLLCQASYTIVDQGLVLNDIRDIDQSHITMVCGEKIALSLWPLCPSSEKLLS